MKIVNYWYCESDTPMNVIAMVKRRMDDGWQPLGGMVYIHDNRYMQTVVKYEEQQPTPQESTNL